LKILQDLEHLGLEKHWHISNLVQQHGALVGHLELTLFRPVGTGKSALLVTKQLAFEKFPGDGSAINLDERPISPDRAEVKCLGDQFLAHPTLATDNDVKIAIRNLPNELFRLYDGLALTNNEAITNVHINTHGSLTCAEFYLPLQLKKPN
jgi:hypothetical protein